MSKEPIFDSIVEHDGAGFTYFRRHASSLAVFSVVIAAGFAMAGAWPIIPFAGVEIAALGTAAYMILRRAGDFERLVFSGNRILIEVRERGARQFEFHRVWARLVTGETDSVVLCSHGRTVEIGRYCCAEGRRALALELRGRLGSNRI